MACPADLSKPGRRYVLETCKTHRVYAHQYGCLEIERIADGATAFFQGDDALALGDEVAKIARKPDWVKCTVLDQYDTILQPAD
jgi:hypothetical protein